MSDYKLGVSDSYVIRTADGATIPNSQTNPDWIAYQAWLRQGGKPEPEFTEEEIATRDLSVSTAKLESLNRNANTQVNALQGRVDTLTDIVEMDEPTAEESAEFAVRKAQLKDWKKYRITLGRITSQDSWPADPGWPIAPEAYVSGVMRLVDDALGV